MYTLLCLPLIYIVYEGSFTQSTTFFTFFYFFLSLQELLLQAMLRTIVLSLPPGCQPTRSAPGAAAQNNCYESSAARPGTPNPEQVFPAGKQNPEQFFDPEQPAPNPNKKARRQRCEPQSPNNLPRAGTSPSKSPTISHPAGCFLGVIRLFRYLLLYLPHHLTLALRSSFSALPFSEIQKAFQALAPCS